MQGLPLPGRPFEEFDYAIGHRQEVNESLEEESGDDQEEDQWELEDRAEHREMENGAFRGSHT